MRKRRTRYTWFQCIGTAGPAADANDDTAAREIVNTVFNNGTAETQIIDWLPDFGSDELAPIPNQVTMGDYQNNAYFIKRIVGKIFCSVQQSAADTQFAAIVAAGFFIARADEGSANGDPIGADSAANRNENYSALRTTNTREPWMWRRTWILANQQATDVSLAGEKFYPRTNADYGSMTDGPHIDMKTARRVNEGERLYMALTTRSFPLDSINTLGLSVRTLVECRVLGQMRKGKGRGVF